MRGKSAKSKVERIIERDGNQCWYCGGEFSPIDPPTVEHMGPERRVPLVDLIELLVAACLLCNHLKGRWSDAIREHERIDVRWARERRNRV